MKPITLILIIGLVLLSGCTETKVADLGRVPPSPPEPKYTAYLNVQEVTEDEPMLAVQKMGWYSSNKTRISHYVDTNLGVMGRNLTLYLVWDSPAELRLDEYSHYLYKGYPDYYGWRGKKVNHYQNNLAKAHRVWLVEIRYDTPQKEELPVLASWENRTLRGDSLRVEGVDFGGSLFTIFITEPGFYEMEYK